MEKIFVAANRCIKSWTWREVAVLKVCLGALGVMAGILVPRRQRRKVFIGAWAAFVITMIPLTVHFALKLKEEAGE